MLGKMGKCAARIEHWDLALVEISRKGDISM